MNTRAAPTPKSRAGRWLPNQDSLEAWLEGLARQVEDRSDATFRHPVLEEFRELIARNPVVRLELTQMIEQVPRTKKYIKRHLIDEVIGQAPAYNETGLVGVPLNAALDWCVGTPAGFAAFRRHEVNTMFREVLKT